MCAPQPKLLGYPKLIENEHTHSRAAQTYRTPSPRLLQGFSSSALFHCVACPACCGTLSSTLDLSPLVVSSTCPVLTIKNVLRLCQMSPAGGGGTVAVPFSELESLLNSILIHPSSGYLWKGCHPPHQAPWGSRLSPGVRNARPGHCGLQGSAWVLPPCVW